MLIAAPARAQAPLAEQQLARAIDRMFVNPQAAYAAARAAESAANKDTAPGPLAAKARWLQGEALSRLDRDAEAEPLVARTLDEARSRWPNTRLHADLLMTWGGIQQNRNHAAVALDAFHQAHNLFRNLRQPRKQAIALVMIASLYNRARDNQSALRYFQAALDVDSGDGNLRMSIFNNRGNALLDMGRPADATREYRQALALASASDEPGLKVPNLNNLARTALLQGKLAAAQRYSDAAYAASPSHGSEFDGSLHALRGQIALQRDRVGEAVAAIDAAFAHISDPSSPVWREVHEAAVDIYARAGRPADALAHLKALKRIDDEVTKVATDTNTALLAARFDATNQQLRIEKLRTSQANQRTRFARDRALFQLLLVGGLLFVAIGGAALLAFALAHIHRSRREVRIANRDLAATNAQLGKALASKREFLATTSHEFRTPLNGILGMSEVLLADTTLGDEARARVAVLQDAGRSMQALVDDVLDMASIDSDAIVLAQAPFSLRAMLENIGERWAAEAAQRGLAFTLDCTDCPATLIGDARRLGQIVHHLLSNAVKFTPAGGVTLAARTTGNGLGVEILVRDTGIGIAADQQALVFGKFYQVDGGTSRAYGGIGMGLALARTFAAAMGGTVTVESRPGTGATFRLRLPEGVSGSGPAIEPVPSPPGSRLLLVEANPLTRGVTLHALRQAGFAVDAVGSAEAAHAHLARGAPDLMLVNAEPAFAADLAALLVAAREREVVTTVLFEPGGAVDAPTTEAMESYQFVAKPIAMEELVERLRSRSTRDAEIVA
jgi:signal transduction histidine kinase/CheY-like chemotaxis protein